VKGIIMPIQSETIELLLVDDEEGIRTVLGIALTDMGYRVHSAANGQQALALFDELAPAIVLTDIKMPGMDGLELLREMKQRNPDTEVIMITGHGDMDLAIQSLKHQATDYITKPIDDDILEVALRRARERIAMREQLYHYTKNLERLVEQKSRQLIQAERLAAVGEAMTGIAHAIKNIAGGLRGGAFIVEKGISLGNDVHIKQGWQMTRDNVARIEQLALDLLDIAKPFRPVFTMTDPGRPAREVYELMASQAREAAIELKLQIADHLPSIPMEAESIHRCLLNLVTNAVDACTRQKDLDPQIDQPPIKLSCNAAVNGIEYKVEDCCGGMAKEVQDKLFETFFTTKGSRGTGIGLMLSRKIITAHQGRIEVDSQPGSGTTFTVWLPGKQSQGKKEKVVDASTPS